MKWKAIASTLDQLLDSVNFTRLLRRAAGWGEIAYLRLSLSTSGLVLRRGTRWREAQIRNIPVLQLAPLPTPSGQTQSRRRKQQRSKLPWPDPIPPPKVGGESAKKRSPRQAARTTEPGTSQRREANPPSSCTPHRHRPKDRPEVGGERRREQQLPM